MRKNKQSVLNIEQPMAAAGQKETPNGLCLRLNGNKC